MNPTLSERLRARRMEPYWRTHPPVRWGVCLEEPLALQVLEAAVTPATAAPFQQSEPAASAEGQAPISADPQPTSAAVEDAPTHQELVLLLLTAVVWLLDGWGALRQSLEAANRLVVRRPRQRPIRLRRARTSVASAAVPGASPCLPIATPSPVGSPMG
jgi:hypothetical protein